MTKFRVYDTLQKCYVTDKALWCITSAGKLTTLKGNPVRNDFIAEYCTGICDENGIEIYDGDIVEDGIVKYHIDSWYIEPKGKDYAEPMLRYNYVYKIIGNIHDTEETQEER